jgi:plastocyanin
MLLRGAPETSTNNGTPPSQQTSEPAEDMNSNNEATEIVINYTDNGFDPSTLEVSVGDVVKVVNDSSSPLQFSSDEHPVHTDNPELNMTTLQPGENGSITITQSGEWGIHNHTRPEHMATLNVIE